MARVQREGILLPCQPRSASAARRFVTHALRSWGWHDDEGVVPLLVSELVTNALLHARTDVRVEVSRRGNRIRVSVEDSAPGEPSRRGHTTGSATGRGLDLVETLADTWGVDRRRQGKAVWFELIGQQVDLDAHASSGARDG